MASAQHSGRFLQEVSDEFRPGSSGGSTWIRGNVFGDALEGGIILSVGRWTGDTF